MQTEWSGWGLTISPPSCVRPVAGNLLAGCYFGFIVGRTSFEFFDKVVGNVLQVILVGAKFIAELTELGQQVFGDLGWETWGVWEALKGLHCV